VTKFSLNAFGEAKQHFVLLRGNNLQGWLWTLWLLLRWWYENKRFERV